MSERNPFAVLDAIYTMGTTDEAWLTGIADQLLPYELSGGLAVYLPQLGPEIALGAAVNRTRYPDASLEQMLLLPPEYFRRLHAPMPLSDGQTFFPKLARELQLEPQWRNDLPFAPPAAWAVVGGDAGVESVIAVFHCKEGETFSTRDAETVDCLGAHLGSALRLRRVVDDGANVDAIFAPDGKVLDARGETKDTEARAPLLDAIRRSERAKLRHATAEERLDVWTALIDGTWSILERTESDGKRILLAHKNPPRARAIRALTSRERAVVTYASLGHSFKYIAYELGIAMQTAAGALDRALAKLGIASREELIVLFARKIAEPLRSNDDSNGRP